MGISRRTLLSLAASAAVAPAAPRVALAQAYPARPVRIVVGYAAGGVADLTARLVSPWLSERLGQQFFVENRPGGGSNLAAEFVTRAPPDGYTLLEMTVSNAINATLYRQLNFSVTRDIAPVAAIMRVPAVLEVNPSFPAKTVPEFIAYAKAHPGKVNLASGGIGSVSHVYGELFKLMAGVDMVHVHYRSSGPALTDLIGGQVEATFDPLPSSIAHIRAGELRPLAVTAGRRLDVLPDIPTVGEFVPRYEASGWQGLAAPAGTPREIVEKLNHAVNAALADEKMKARLADMGGTITTGSPDDFRAHIAAEIDKWAKVVRFARASAE
jgi:tripartite-type tricarboxylate transporter receptor subunit TctC